MSITWNGVSSDTIGVIVERIPNRHVPTRRFSPQQVAGRNGNILLVDKAFPNVEQEYEVYLSAESQGLPSVARACAEWLMGPDGYCRLTDSYDTTVYREAFLMGGFDIENILNKFGRCTITFSCKPQKYLLTGDTPIEIPDGTTTTYTGDVVQFDVITGASITSLSTAITPTQDLHGYSSPWPAGGGKNAMPSGEAGTKESNGITVTSDGHGHYTVSGTSSYAVEILFDLETEFTIPTSDTHSLFFMNDIGVSGVTFYFRNGSTNIDSFGLSTANKASASYVTIGGKVCNRVRFYISSNTAIPGTMHLSPMIVTKDVAGNSFIPYSNICPITGRTGVSVYVSPTQDVSDATTYAVDWTTEAGTVYGGTLDVVTGVLTVDRAIQNLWEMGWLYMSDVGVFYTSNSLPAKFAPCLSNIYAYNSASVGSGRPDMTINVGISYFGVNRVSVKDSRYTSTSDLRQMLEDNGAVLCYELATPLTYQLTAQEIEALVGTNNVWSSSGAVSVTVATPLGGIVTNPTPFEARPLLEVSGVGEITINGKSIQILESVSDFEIDCETMEAEDNSKIYCMDFPELSGGENEIVGDGSITALTVTPRWWTL